MLWLIVNNAWLLVQSVQLKSRLKWIIYRVLCQICCTFLRAVLLEQQLKLHPARNLHYWEKSLWATVPFFLFSFLSVLNWWSVITFSLACFSCNSSDVSPRKSSRDLSRIYSHLVFPTRWSFQVWFSSFCVAVWIWFLFIYAVFCTFVVLSLIHIWRCRRPYAFRVTWFRFWYK